MPRDEDDFERSLPELRSHCRALLAKLAPLRRERDQLFKDNQRLQNQLLSLQSAHRFMTPGQNNTSSNFPLPKELATHVAQFYKYDCSDLFFDGLVPKLADPVPIGLFFRAVFEHCEQVVLQYFEPLYRTLTERGCFNSLQGPALNALRKGFQQNYSAIQGKAIRAERTGQRAQELCAQFGLRQYGEQVEALLKRGNELFLQMHLSDPPLRVEWRGAGLFQQFSTLRHDPLDGFVRGKEKVVVLTGEVVRGGEVVVKGLVLPADYKC